MTLRFCEDPTQTIFNNSVKLKQKLDSPLTFKEQTNKKSSREFVKIIHEMSLLSETGNRQTEINNFHAMN